MCWICLRSETERLTELKYLLNTIVHLKIYQINRAAIKRIRIEFITNWNDYHHQLFVFFDNIKYDR